MKKTLAILLGVVIAVVGIYALGETQPTGWLSILANDSTAAVQFRALSTYGAPVTIGHGTAAPTAANTGAPPMDGEIYMTRAAATDPVMSIYSQNDTAWYIIPNGDTQSIAGAWTFASTLTSTGAFTANDDATLGSNEDDNIIMNSPIVYNVRREDFESPGITSSYLAFNDWLIANYAVTDAAHNLLINPRGMTHLFRYEQAMAGTCDPLDMGQLTLASCVDDAINDGIVWYYNLGQIPDGTLPLHADFDESDNRNMYCEIQIDLANISAIDDLWFGWTIDDAIDDPPASASYDTSALWTISDAAGDIDLATLLNGGAELTDDAGTDWTDGDQFVLRVNVNADTVTFEGCLTDGCDPDTIALIPSPTAILNVDDDDHMLCVMGYTAAAAEELGLTVEYIEVGRTQ